MKHTALDVTGFLFIGILLFGAYEAWQAIQNVDSALENVAN